MSSSILMEKLAPEANPLIDDFGLVPRYPCDLETVCQPIAARGKGEPVWSVRFQDISTGGVGMRVVRRFERGTGLAIEIPADGEELSDTLLARVVYVRSAGDDGWHIGCEFVSPLSDESVQRLIHLKTPHETIDAQSIDEHGNVQHSSESSNGLSNGAALHPSMQQAIVQSVRWMDSFTGVVRTSRRLILTGSWPLRKNTVLRMWLNSKSGERDKTRVRIDSCTRQGDQWTVCYTVLGKLSSKMAKWVKRN